jgi:hypothetical protein
MSHEFYIHALSAMFLFWNGARILTYIPTIGKLLSRETDVRSHSLLSWCSWTLSNGTFALMLLEMSHGIPNQMFWLNLANTLLCLVVSFIIVVRRFRWLQKFVNYPAHSGAGSLAVDVNLEVNPVLATSPVRFRRLALWLVSASALAAAVVGIVAFGDPFDHDQRAHGARGNARQVPGTIELASPAHQTFSSGPVAPSLSPRATTITSAELAPPVSSAPAHHRAGHSPDSAAPHSAARRSVQTSYSDTQNRRHQASQVTAMARQAPGVSRSIRIPEQSSASNHVPRPPSAWGTAVASAELSPPVPSASFEHRTAPSPDSASSQLTEGQPGESSYSARQYRPQSPQHAPVHEPPPPVAYKAPLVVYQEVPVAYAPAPAVYGYEGEYWNRRHWHDNGWHKGWKQHHHDDDDE